jgi:hypothetical protein
LRCFIAVAKLKSFTQAGSAAAWRMERNLLPMPERSYSI